MALNIKTPVSFITPYANLIDQVLLVSSEAEEDGLPFCRGVLNKVREARTIMPQGSMIWVDGAVTLDNLASIVEAGATGAVVGRGVFSAADPVKAYRELVSFGTELVTKMKIGQ